MRFKAICNNINIICCLAYIAFVLQVAKALVEVFAEMIFIHGFLHGDPHPGNILVSPEAEGQSGFSLGMLND